MSFISMRPTFEKIFAQDFNSGLFLARGHLAPNADFIFYSLMVHHGKKTNFIRSKLIAMFIQYFCKWTFLLYQDSTYHFINVAPQWQSFNGMV